MNHTTKLINELRDALVDVTDRLEKYGRGAAPISFGELLATEQIIARARVAIEKATTT